jgi:hypothetical protein
MGKKIIFCTLFISFQGTNDYWLEMRGRDDAGVNVGHIEREEYVREPQGPLRGEKTLGAAAQGITSNTCICTVLWFPWAMTG